MPGSKPAQIERLFTAIAGDDYDEAVEFMGKITGSMPNGRYEADQIERLRKGEEIKPGEYYMFLAILSQGLDVLLESGYQVQSQVEQNLVNFMMTEHDAG